MKKDIFYHMNKPDLRAIKPYLEKKIIKGIIYYQLVKKARIDGKVKRVWSKYLGTAGNIEKVYNQVENKTSIQIKSFEYGRTAALMKIAEELNFIEIINRYTTKKNVDGLSVGEYLLLLILGRANGPVSKNKTSEWFKDSFLDIIWSFPHQLNTNNFTNHMDYITDEAMNKIEEDIGKFLINQGLKPSMLFFDTTNFYTYIENGENIPQKGKSKEHRSDKNLIGLGLAVSEENIPLLHESYPGNSPDVKIFKIIFEKLVERLNALNVPTGDIVLVFDKGCNSKPNIDTVLSKMHIVGSIKKNQAEELFSVPLENYELLYTNKKKHQVKGYRIKKTVFGTEFTVVASYNSGSFKKQSETYKKDKIIIFEKLKEIKQSVERTGRGKKKDLKNALIEASKFVYEGYKKVFLFEGNEKDNVFSYKVDEEEEKELFLTFGKNLLFTDMHDWTTEKIVKSYNQKDLIENDFKWLKTVVLMPIKPIFLQKDSRIKVHSFICVMGLVFYRYLLWKLKRQNELLSETRVIEELEKIRVALVKRDDEKPNFIFEHMDLDQMRLFTELRLDTVLKDT
ncbi:MAG: IS1634 family transposase [Candidatus Methanoperedens sp.]|nr:IS1634 family transposase [Candidatus Methanoperedens sp.]